MSPRRLRLFLLLSPAFVVLALGALIVWREAPPPRASELTGNWSGLTFGTQGMYLTPHRRTMRMPQLRADGTFALDVFLSGDGTWRIDGNRVLLEFRKVDGVPIERFNREWPARREALLLGTWKEVQGAPHQAYLQHKGKPYVRWRKEIVANYPRVLENPYEKPWIFRLRRNAITPKGLRTKLEQEGQGYTHLVFDR